MDQTDLPECSHFNNGECVGSASALCVEQGAANLVFEAQGAVLERLRNRFGLKMLP